MLAQPLPLDENVIEIQGVTRKFGVKRALDNVSLVVPRGVVFGLVGANGAGKTTLIRHVLGLLKAQTGSVRVFGLDPVAGAGQRVVADRLFIGRGRFARLDADR